MAIACWRRPLLVSSLTEFCSPILWVSIKSWTNNPKFLKSNPLMHHLTRRLNSYAYSALSLNEYRGLEFTCDPGSTQQCYRTVSRSVVIHLLHPLTMRLASSLPRPFAGCCSHWELSYRHFHHCREYRLLIRHCLLLVSHWIYCTTLFGSPSIPIHLIMCLCTIHTVLGSFSLAHPSLQCYSAQYIS